MNRVCSCWFNLRKRSTLSKVTGSIHLALYFEPLGAGVSQQEVQSNLSKIRSMLTKSKEEKQMGLSFLKQSFEKAVLMDEEDVDSNRAPSPNPNSSNHNPNSSQPNLSFAQHKPNSIRPNSNSNHSKLNTAQLNPTMFVAERTGDTEENGSTLVDVRIEEREDVNEPQVEQIVQSKESETLCEETKEGEHKNSEIEGRNSLNMSDEQPSGTESVHSAFSGDAKENDKN